MSQITDLLDADHRIHDNWVVSFKTWSRRSYRQSYGRAQTCRNQSNVWNSQRLLHVIPKFETKILRSVIFAQVKKLISVAPTLQNLKIGLRRRQSGTENRCLPASTLKPEEREFVVDSGASMHMISKKDLKDACSPSIVITANGEVQTHEEATVYVKELDIFLTMKVLEDTPAVFVAWKSFAMKTDVLMNGSTVKNHISLKTGLGFHAIRRTSFLSWFQACHRVLHPVLILQLQRHFQDRRVIVPHLLPARLRHQRWHQVVMRLENERIELKVTSLSSDCVN